MNVWIEAARPRTLAAGVVPVVVGTAAAGRVIAWRAAAALVVGVSIQVAVNYANDYFDGVRGVDTPERVGPRRAVASGLVEPARMRAALAAAMSVCAAAGLALAIAVGPVLLLVGAASIAAALAYSGGPRPYGSAGLGEVFVFVFFGLVATAGSAYVHDEHIRAAPVAASVPVGLLATALLVVNNLRDVDTDRAAGKRTLAVVIGARRTRVLYGGLVAAAFVSVAAVVAAADSPGPAAALAAAPLGVAAAARVRSARSPADLVAALGATARLQVVAGGLMAAGLWPS